MLKSKLNSLLFGGGAALVCSAGMAAAQPQGIPVEDPTIETPTYCTYHLVPSNPNAQPEGGPTQTPFGWLFNSPLYPPLYSSWLGTPTLQPWVPDRRPMMTVQLGSDGWTQNSRGLTGRWWISSTYQDANNTVRLRADTADGHVPYIGDGHDHYSPNIPSLGGTFNSDKEWLVNGSGQFIEAPNGVPDQFDFLIRTILRWREQGIRRVMLYLPAGVIAGKLVGFDYDGNRKPYFGGPHQGVDNYKIFVGTAQSMNQFHGMPPWKQSYLLGQDLQMGPFASQNAWRDFLHDYCNSEFTDDPMDIEVYIGGGIPISSAGLPTERTDINYHNNIQVNDPYDNLPERLDNFAGYDDDNRTIEIRNFVWREWNGTTIPPVPIDPRYNFYYWNSSANVMETRHGNMNHVWNEVSPWFGCGIKRIWFDTASENVPAASSTDYGHERRWGALEFAHNPYVRANGIRIGGETVPTIDLPGGAEILDDCAVGHMPWFGLFQAVSYEDNASTHHRAFKTYAMTTLSRNTTEVHLLDNTEHMDWTNFQYAREHNYVVGAWNAYGSNPKTAEMMKRWYSIGKIKVADFNGDGTIDSTDYQMAYDAIQRGIAYHADPQHNGAHIFPAVFGNGDIDGNGKIEAADWTLFQETYWLAHLNGNDIVTEFKVVGTGAANHDY